jgi:hypothetical protein
MSLRLDALESLKMRYGGRNINVYHFVPFSGQPVKLQLKEGCSRQEVIRDILRTYGTLDRVDVICLGVRFHVGAEVITEDVTSAKEALKQEAAVQQRGAREAQERAAELALAREILKRGGV